MSCLRKEPIKTYNVYIQIVVTPYYKDKIFFFSEFYRDHVNFFTMFSSDQLYPRYSPKEKV